MRKRHLIPVAALLVSSLGMAPATSADLGPEASKTGVCVHVPRIQDKPLCVLVDPAE